MDQLLRVHSAPVSDTRLGGRIEGDIRVDGLLLITESGVVTGSVRADNANIAGTVNGEISVVKKALLTQLSQHSRTHIHRSFGY